MEYFKDTWSLLTPIVTAVLTYFIAIRGKRKDITLEKEKKLNTVTSDLMDVFYFLKSLNRISDLNKENLPFPPGMFSLVVMNSGMIDDSCLQELQKSVRFLKSYDPITYSDLNGIGERFNYLQSNFITPLLTSKNNQELNSNISKSYLTDLIKEIEVHLLTVSKQVNRRNHKMIKSKIDKKIEIKEIKQELINNYYDFLRKLPHYENFTNEQLEKETSSEDFKRSMEAQSAVIEIADTKKLMKIAAEYPYISVEEMKERLGIEVPQPKS